MFSTGNIQFRPFYKLKFQVQHGLHGECLKCHCSLITNTTLCFVFNLFTVMVFCLLLHVDNWNMALIVTTDHFLASLFSLPVYRCFVYLFLHILQSHLSFCDQEHIHFVLHGLMMLNTKWSEIPFWTWSGENVKMNTWMHIFFSVLT